MKSNNSNFINSAHPHAVGTPEPDNDIFLNSAVKKGLGTIRQRLDTLLESRGEKWADVYNDLGWNKSFASIVHNGLLIPPLWQRVAVAKRMNVDSSVIWKVPEIVSAEMLEAEK